MRDAFRRAEPAAWHQVQRRTVAKLFEQDLIQGEVYAVDRTGLGSDYQLVSLVCVSDERPRIVAWRVTMQTASEKGKRACLTRELIEQAVEFGAEIDLLLADGLCADGPFLTWLKHEMDIDALVRLPEDRRLYEDIQGLAHSDLLSWSEHSYVRRIQGEKQRHGVECAAADDFTTWSSYVDAATEHGAEDPKLWACLIRECEPDEQSGDEAMALVSTRSWDCGFDAFQAYRPRWHIENDAYRELKEGWGIEKQRWG